ncbi:MAG: hypothetical protein ACRDRJ_09220 [Streptosporangiaceae bacterium]
MSTNFSPAQSQALFDALQSGMQQLSLFQATDTHEPESPPGKRLYCSIVLGPLKAVTTSGLGKTSGQVTFTIRIWSNAKQRPLDKIDPELLAAAAAVMGWLSGEFTLGGTVRNIQLLDMTAVPEWIEFEGQQFRASEVTVPIVINDMWVQSA